jgi:hypothetical protein
MAQRSGSEDTSISYFRPISGGADHLHSVLTPSSTSTVPAATYCKIYNTSLQEEIYSRATSQYPRLSTRTSIGFARLNYPGQVPACGGGCQQADIWTQGHGCSVQGDEIAASSDVQHQASDLDQVRPFPFSLGTSPYRARFTDACQYHTNWIDY